MYLHKEKSNGKTLVMSENGFLKVRSIRIVMSWKKWLSSIRKTTTNLERFYNGFF